MSDTPTTSGSNYTSSTPSAPDFSLKEAQTEAEENVHGADTHADKVTPEEVKFSIEDNVQGGLMRGKW